MIPRKQRFFRECLVTIERILQAIGSDPSSREYYERKRKRVFEQLVEAQIDEFARKQG